MNLCPLVVQYISITRLLDVVTLDINKYMQKYYVSKYIVTQENNNRRYTRKMFKFSRISLTQYMYSEHLSNNKFSFETL